MGHPVINDGPVITYHELHTLYEQPLSSLSTFLLNVNLMVLASPASPGSRQAQPCLLARNICLEAGILNIQTLSVYMDTRNPLKESQLFKDPCNTHFLPW